MAAGPTCATRADLHRAVWVRDETGGHRTHLEVFMPRRPGQLDERSFARHLRELERVGSDSRVRVELAARGAIDLAGNVIPRHVYRLECGHMEQVHGTALPTATRELHCPRCGRWRPIVEHLT